MSFRDCISDKEGDGEISKEQADRARMLFDDIELELKNKMSATQAQIEAGRKAYEGMKFEQAESKRRKLLQLKAWQNIVKNLKEYKNAKGENDIFDAARALFDRDEFASYSNLEFRRKAVISRLHSRMTDVLETFRRDILGRERNPAKMDNVVRELFGSDTGDISAKELAKAWTEASEFARLRFNAAGGHIPKREAWGMPQTHDTLAVRKSTFKEWRDSILPRLDLNKMTDESTGLPFTREKIETVLQGVYDTIRTQGFSDVKPTAGGGGKALANRRADHRFLVFKDADAFLDYHKQFGAGSPFDVMMGHLDGMARDIAALEILGPNPNASIRMIEQTLKKQGNTLDAEIAGKDKNLSRANSAIKSINTMYSHYTGGVNAPVSGSWARGFSGVRQVLQSAQLGAAFLSAITDLNFGRLARAHAGLPQKRMIKDIVKLMSPTNIADQKAAVRMGLIAENWSQVASAQLRYVGEISGGEISRRVADFVMRASGLSPWTQAGRWAFGQEFMGAMADYSVKAFSELPEALQRTMQKYRIDADVWEIIRQTESYTHKGADFLTPENIAARSDLAPSLSDDLATRVLEMIQTETEFAVPSSSLRGRATIVGDSQPGTFQGELIRSVAMYKNFAVTLMNTHLARMAAKNTAFNMFKYGGSLLVTSTLMGALAIQLKEISKGRDPRPMTSAAFWGAALMQGGGLGIFGDFLFSNVNRFGGGLGETIAGPVIGLLDDVREVTVGNAMQLSAGDKTSFGNDATNFVKRYTPGASIWWSRLALERFVFDTIQEEIDSDFNKRARRREKFYRREFGQEYWWRPGETTPERTPNISNVMESTQ